MNNEATTCDMKYVDSLLIWLWNVNRKKVERDVN